MAKIDEIKEVLNTLRVAMSLVAGIIVVLVGRLFSKVEKNEIDYYFWVIVISTIIMAIIEIVIVKKIAQRTKEIRDL